MAHKVIDRCKETTSTTGTGTLTLTGAVANFVAMANATAGLTTDGDTSWFCAENGAEWEVFLGTRVDSTHLARTAVISSSNAGAAVNFTAPPTVFGTVPASKISAVGPAFSAYRATSTQAITTATTTKVALNAEDFDTAACFDSTTNYRFTPNVAGYYRFEWLVNITAASVTSAVAFLRKNGSDVASGTSTPATTTQIQTGGSKLIYMNGSSDYVELFVYATGTSLTVAVGTDKAFLTGSFVRGG